MAAEEGHEHLQNNEVLPTGDDIINTNHEPFGNSPSQQSNIPGQDVPFAVNLIEEIRRYPCVWNISLPSHKDKPKKLEA